ncbi:MAG: alpha-L-rhamnosidase [Planctomycetota bacterium]
MNWTAKWIASPGAGPDVVAEYRFDCDRHVDTLRVSADQRFVLFADDVEVARGPTRGTIDAWPFHTVDLGRHVGVLHAVVWSLRDEVAPLAQISWRHGFVLQGGGCDTGDAAWRVRELGGYLFERMPPPYGCSYAGGPEMFDGGAADGPWQTPAVVGDAGEPMSQWGERRGPTLVHNPLPPLHAARWPTRTVRHVDEEDADAPFGDSADRITWQPLFDLGTPVTVPPHHRVRLLLDLSDYVCGYDQTTITGPGATVRIGWQEALVDADGVKGQRDDIVGKQMRGRWQTVRVGTEPVDHRSLWWTAGRYRCVVIETAEAPANVSALDVIETRYPLELRSRQTVDPRIDALVPMCFRTLQCCAHETYVDCPHYEQLQYVGDTRVQALVSYACCGDDRLARHALRSYARSVTPDGLVRARFPDRSEQVIPQFALQWVGMLHDFMMWRDDRALVRELMPTVRMVCECFLSRRQSDGLVAWPDGWNWVDWQPAWERGTPPGHDAGLPSGINHWQLVWTLRQAAALERHVGDALLEQRLSTAADELADTIDAAFWDDQVGAWADTPKRDSFSQHAQVYAILAGTEHAERAAALLDGRLGVTRGSYYFQHHVFEALHRLGRGGEVLDRLGAWDDMRALGLRTTAEHAEPTRSDCHAWSAHPLLHMHTTLAGIRPAAPGFTRVSVRPTVANLHVCMMHPRGVVDVRVVDGDVSLKLPDGVEAVG